MKLTKKLLLTSVLSLSVLSLPIVALSCGQTAQVVNDSFAVTQWQKYQDQYNSSTKTWDLSQADIKEIPNQGFSFIALANLTYGEERKADGTIDNSKVKIAVIENIILPASLQKIGDRAFYNVSALKNVDFSKATSLSSIGSNAFEGTSIENIQLPESLTQIGSEAFENTKLTTVKIPSSVKIIENSTFFGANLQSVTLDGVQKIRGYAFGNNPELKEVVLPESVNEMDITAFDNDHGQEYQSPVSLTVNNAELKQALTTELQTNTNHNFTIK
ncbi:leucine-rich repeat domain-containing protein [Mycoplasma sp. 128]|uniref:leucine-rich repeat domain-containing protein n=1 Tax=Mycoplasma sp. 3341 TaxID=3447506 RepID=UPI003F65BA66